MFVGIGKVPAQLPAESLEDMRREVMELAAAAELAAESAQRNRRRVGVGGKGPGQKAARNSEAGKKLLEHNWSFADIGGGAAGDDGDSARKCAATADFTVAAAAAAA